MAETNRIPPRTVTPPKYPALREHSALTNGANRDGNPRVKSPGYSPKDTVAYVENGSQEDEIANTPVNNTDQPPEKQVHRHRSTTPSPVNEAEAAALNKIKDELAQLDNPEANQMELVNGIDEQIKNIDPKNQSNVKAQFYHKIQGVMDQKLAQYGNSLKDTGPASDLLGDHSLVIDIYSLINACSERNLLISPNKVSTLRTNVQRQLLAMLRPAVQDHTRYPASSDAFSETSKAVNAFTKIIKLLSPNDGSQIQAQLQIQLRTMISNYEKQIAFDMQRKLLAMLPPADGEKDALSKLNAFRETSKGASAFIETIKLISLDDGSQIQAQLQTQLRAVIGNYEKQIAFVMQRQLLAMLQPADGERQALSELSAFSDTFKTANAVIKTINEVSPDDGFQIQAQMRVLIEKLPHEKQIALVQLIGASIKTLALQQTNSRDESIAHQIADRFAIFTLVIEAQTSDRLPTNPKQCSIQLNNVNELLIAFNEATTNTKKADTNKDDPSYILFQKRMVWTLLPIVKKAYSAVFLAEFANPRINTEDRKALAGPFNKAFARYITSLSETFDAPVRNFLDPEVVKLKENMYSELQTKRDILLTGKPGLSKDDYNEAMDTIGVVPKANTRVAGQ